MIGGISRLRITSLVDFVRGTAGFWERTGENQPEFTVVPADALIDCSKNQTYS